MKTKEWFSLCARGAALGGGVLPGVSAGTVGIIVDVYDDVLQGFDGLRKRKTFFSSFLRLVPIGIGAIVAVVLLMLFWSKVARSYFPFILICVLAGFVLGALPIITDELRGKKPRMADYLRMLIGFLVAAAIGIAAFVVELLYARGIISSNLNLQSAMDAPFQNIWILLVVLAAGFFSAVSCLVPGISGSMLLFIFGLYQPILNLFFNQYDAEGNVIHTSIFHDTSKLGGGAVILLVFLVGIAVGFVSTSHFLKKMLSEHHYGTYTVVLGFVLGSIVSMFLNQEMYGVYTSPATNAWWQFAIGGVLLIASCVGTYLLILKFGRRQLKVEKTPSENE